MYIVTGISIETGKREVLSEHQTSASTDNWFNKVARYCNSHYLFTVVNTEFKSENVRPVARAGAINRIFNHESPIALTAIDKAPEHLF